MMPIRIYQLVAALCLLLASLGVRPAAAQQDAVKLVTIETGEGVMKGTTAIAQGRYGRGRVFCFSPHPEMTKGLESLLHYAIDSVKRNRLQQKSRIPIE